jgi:hypothetical protein
MLGDDLALHRLTGIRRNRETKDGRFGGLDGSPPGGLPQQRNRLLAALPDGPSGATSHENGAIPQTFRGYRQGPDSSATRKSARRFRSDQGRGIRPLDRRQTLTKRLHRSPSHCGGSHRRVSILERTLHEIRRKTAVELGNGVDHVGPDGRFHPEERGKIIPELP